MWMLLMFFAVSLAQDVSVIPSVTRLTVVEKSSESIECILTSTSKTANLSWVKLSPEGKDYFQVDSLSRTTENADGTFTLQRYLVFPSFSPDDAGTYKCSFTKPRSANEWQIHLTLQKICDYGKYGLDCMSNCSQTCKTTGPGVNKSPCEYIDGTCRYGCLPGYKGANCSSVCDSGKYGVECSNTCSPNCLDEGSPDESVCSHVTGKCLDGCRKGYTGDLCTDVLEAPTSNTGIIVGVVVGVLCALILLLISIFFIIRARRKRRGINLPPSQKDEDTVKSSLNNPGTPGNESLTQERPRSNGRDFQPPRSQVEGDKMLKTPLLENPGEPDNDSVIQETLRNDLRAPVAVSEDSGLGQMVKDPLKAIPQSANTSTNRKSPQAGPSHRRGSSNTNTHQKKPGAPDDPDAEGPSTSNPGTTNPNGSGVKTTKPGNNPATLRSLSIGSMNSATAVDFDSPAALLDSYRRERKKQNQQTVQLEQRLKYLEDQHEKQDKESEREKACQERIKQLESEKHRLEKVCDEANKQILAQKDKEIAELEAKLQRKEKQEAKDQIIAKAMKNLWKTKRDYAENINLRKDTGSHQIQELQEIIRNCEEEMDKKGLEREGILYQLLMQDLTEVAAEVYAANNNEHNVEKGRLEELRQELEEVKQENEELRRKAEDIDKRAWKQLQSSAQGASAVSESQAALHDTASGVDPDRNMELEECEDKDLSEFNVHSKN